MQFGFQTCPYCNARNGFEYVHGHYQCRVCFQNVMPCCGGEQETDNQDEPDAVKPDSSQVENN